MTTENEVYRVEKAADLFAPNPCIHLPGLNGQVVEGLASITVSRVGTPQERGDILWACARYAWEAVLPPMQPLQRWLLACICVEDTRVTRHQGLWKSSLMRDVASKMRTTEEVVRERGDGTIAVYGAAAFDDEPEDLRPLVTPASRSFIALLPEGQAPPVELAIAAGWNRGLNDIVELRDLGLIIADRGGILLRFFGEFDDREIGVDCIMRASSYQRAVAITGVPTT